MYLKKLEIQGFKSFPEYTLIEFDQGMTAVVGPNGSGKSNVTDAIRWVLGEQSVKSLRGGKMEDVIFNGTSTRKAMNYAEVTLTLDNSDNFIDYEFSELEITRRLYRSGESEYQINHVNCRLKDIVRLFLDTGLGKDGYSIVGQGRVDEILSTKSEDRRRVIEEASGIVKYKVRKEEAERKLNSTEQNLLRIDDILNELSERIGPLKEQSEKAIAYHKAYEELKTNDIALLLRRIDDANEAMGDSGNVKATLEAEIKEQEDRFLEFRNSNSGLESRSEELDIEIEDKRQLLSDISEEMYEVSSDLKINLEKIRTIDSDITSSNEDEEKLNSEIERIGSEYKVQIEKADELLNKANDEKRKAEDFVNQREALLVEFRDSEKDNDSIKKQIEDKNAELFGTRERITVSEEKINSISERLNELTNERKNSSTIREELEAQLKDSDKAWHDLMVQEGEVTSDIDSRDASLKDLIKKETKMLSEYETLNRTFLADRSKLKTLKELEASKEGYQESVRRLINSVNSIPDLKSGIVGVVGDLISTEKEYEIAIEIALGSSIHNVVTYKENDAAKLITHLKNNRLGRVTFLPIDNIRPRSIDNSTIVSVERKKGYIGVAADLVKNDRKIDDIVMSLLGKIIICETMDDARSIARDTKHSIKVITLDGDCINPGGSLTGGSVRRDSAGILGRARIIEDLSSKIDEAEKKLASMDDERQEIDEKKVDLEREIAQLTEQLKYFSMERVKAETEFKNLNDRMNSLKSDITEVEKTIHELSNDKLRIEDDLEELRQIAKETEGDLDDFREDIVKSDNLAKEFSEKLESLREKISECNNISDRLLAQRNGVMDLARHMKSQIDSCKSNLEQLISERSELTTSKDEILKSNTELETKLSEFKVNSEKLSEEIKQLNEEKATVDKERSGFVSKLTAINDELNNLRNRYNSLVSKYEKYINDIDFSKNRLWEDYETTYDNCTGKYPAIDNIGDTQKLISSLKAQIKAIGPVNLNSVEEYKEISERFEFMSAQRNDIYEAKTNLEKVISELLEEMKGQFIEQFTTINENFKTVFNDLFNGGSAEIVLENEEDVLNCAIEIKAQPPGKKLQSLTLLSGGERCLTAIALLFAILQLRPSPFVILDEVEAALDDVNVSRFADFVRRYTARSQFIVVTHRKGTMEACDRMYGVTMQERGISKILSMRIQ